jgi:hypothetical protein
VAERDNSGRFEKGHTKLGGRAKAEVKMAFLDAVIAAHDPESITDNLRWCVECAKRQNSPRMVLAVTEFEIENIIGKAVIRSEATNGNAIEEAMQRWKEMQAQSEQAEIEQMFKEPKELAS